MRLVQVPPTSYFGGVPSLDFDLLQPSMWELWLDCQLALCKPSSNVSSRPRSPRKVVPFSILDRLVDSSQCRPCGGCTFADSVSQDHSGPQMCERRVGGE